MRSYCVGRADGLEYRVESKEWRCGVGSADNIASSERGAMGALYALNECVFASLPQALSRQLPHQREPWVRVDQRQSLELKRRVSGTSTPLSTLRS